MDSMQNLIKDVKSLARVWRATEAVCQLAEQLEARSQDSQNLDRAVSEKAQKLQALKDEHEKLVFEAAAFRAKEEARARQANADMSTNLEEYRFQCTEEANKLEADIEHTRAEFAHELADLESERELLRQDVKKLVAQREEIEESIAKIKQRLG